MSAEVVPLLEILRALYALPRGRSRFDRYLSLMVTPAGEMRTPPLQYVNPMARPRAAEVVDLLLALDAERLASEAVAALSTSPDDPVRLSPVVLDDAGGGWTRREFVELTLRTRAETRHTRNWLPVPFWTSETPTPESVRAETLATWFRARLLDRQGPPVTLRDILAQEGQTAAFAGTTEGGELDPEELDYTRQVVAPFLAATHPSDLIPCLYGDASAKAVGYAPVGLSPRAGFALARHEERVRPINRRPR